MSIADLLTPERVVAKADITSKKRALEYLSTLIAENRPDLDQEEIFTSLLTREKLGSTGLGNHVALPHGRIHHEGPAVGAFVTTTGPIDFDAIDDQPVDLLFALIVPEESTDEHLLILAQLAEMFRDESFCERLRQTPDAVTLLDLLANWRSAGSSAA